MHALLEKLIEPVLSTIKLRHPETPAAPHAHTAAVITQDAEGQYWLGVKCRHGKCPGQVRRKIPEWLAREWENENETG